MVIKHSQEQSDFLLAFKGKNIKVPVWFMRQAGRYLPQYRALKAKCTLNEMFQDPDIASEITLQPIRLIGVDAAILFADILTLPSSIGFKVDFIDGKGPVISNPITQRNDIKRMHVFKGLDYVVQTIEKVNAQLPNNIPLIGFAGSPFTVLTYLCPKYLKLMVEDPKNFHIFMNFLTSATIGYLKMQQKAGIKAFQLFDTWAGQLRETDYREFVLPYVQRIFNSIKLPSIYYLKNCSHLMPLMAKSGADMLSVCETVVIGEPLLQKQTLGIQGNFFNGLLYADDDIVVKETQKILKSARQYHRKYIFNLSHGIFPDVNPEKLKLIVKTIKSFPWRL